MFGLTMIGFAEDYRDSSLLERKQALKYLLWPRARDGLQYVDHLKGNGRTSFEHVCRIGLESNASYRSGRIAVTVQAAPRAG